jgi:hypothetical protein
VVKSKVIMSLRQTVLAMQMLRYTGGADSISGASMLLNKPIAYDNSIERY